MLYFDIAMPIALFTITLASLFLERRIKGKIKKTFEEREFRARDAIIFVVMICIAVSIIVFIPQFAIMAVFLFSYSTLLFTFSYIFSDMTAKKTQLYCFIIAFISLFAGGVAIFTSSIGNAFFYSGAALIALAIFAFLIALKEQKAPKSNERWYFAVLPPVLFLLLYLAFNGSALWGSFLVNAYGAIFAVLIVLYVGSLFTWKSALVFAGFLTLMDVILVLGTGTMITAAQTVARLNLPVLISLPTIPLIITEQGILYMSLGLGDFFFTGILAIQTLRKFDKQTALIAAIAMSLSFAVFETLLLNFQFGAFPGTLMIICGWLPIILLKTLKRKK